jgi:glycosyltransferase involved in cell wall biosynthesis
VLDVPLGRPAVIRGVEVTFFPAKGSKHYKISLPMAEALKANLCGYDVVHINALYQFSTAIAAYYCRKYDIPYVLTPHGALDPYMYRHHRARKLIYEALIERYNLSRAAAVHFTTVEEMELASSLGLGFRGMVAPLGLEIDHGMLTNNETSEWSCPKLAGKKVVLFLSRINFKKGLDLLAGAFGEIHRKDNSAHLIVAGPDNEGYSEKVSKWFTDARALDAVTFAGMVLGVKKAALLRRAQLFVLPSYSENFGLAVVEAMAAGLPVVISNKVNIWRKIDEADAGLVVNTDAHELACAILWLLDNPLLAKEMGERGRRFARENFSWRTAGDQLVRIYEQVTLNNRPLDTITEHS